MIVPVIIVATIGLWVRGLILACTTHVQGSSTQDVSECHPHSFPADTRPQMAVLCCDTHCLLVPSRVLSSQADVHIWSLWKSLPPPCRGFRV